MTIQINGTTGISGVDGSAATPALQGTDTNTGISFGSDIILASTGGSERWRTDASGRLLVGTTTGTSRLSIAGTADNTNSEIQITATGVASGYIGANSNGLNIGTDTAGLVFKTGVTGGGSVGASGTERMRIDSSGRAGFGETSPVAQVHSSVASGTDRVCVRAQQAHSTALGFFMQTLNASYAGDGFRIDQTRSATSACNFFICDSAVGGSQDREFTLRGDGNAFADGTWAGGGADYAEYFEWSDGNLDEEDRRGISVVLDGNQIRPAVDGEDPIGVISGNPSVVGDAAWNKWSGKYLRDDYGTYIQEDYEVVNDEGETVIQQRRKLNPAYDPDQEYINREQRPEWDCVGLMGKLRIRKEIGRAHV